MAVMELTAAASALAIVASAWLYARMRWRDLQDPANFGIPGKLRAAELAFAERTFRSSRWGLVARVDRMYRWDGALYLMELKTRARPVVHLSDIIELSAQRLAAQDETGEPVSRTAWVVVQHPRNGRRSAHKVQLLRSTEVMNLRARYRLIVQGEASELGMAASPRQCDNCGHRDRCRARYVATTLGATGQDSAAAAGR